jgi:hypothetical protein
MADVEMDFLVQNHRPGLQSRSSSLEAYHFAQSQDIGTHYHDSVSSIAHLGPEPTDIEEKVRDCTLTKEFTSAKGLDADLIFTSTDSAGSSSQYKDARTWWSDWWIASPLSSLCSKEWMVDHYLIGTLSSKEACLVDMPCRLRPTRSSHFSRLSPNPVWVLPQLRVSVR